MSIPTKRLALPRTTLIICAETILARFWKLSLRILSLIQSIISLVPAFAASFIHLTICGKFCRWCSDHDEKYASLCGIVFIRLTMLMTICGTTKYPISAKNATIISIEIALALILAIARFLLVRVVASS